MIPWWAALAISLVACFFTAWCIDKMRRADEVASRIQGLERTATTIEGWRAQQVESSIQRVEAYKAMLYDCWRTMAGQSRGLQRQARKIRRLKAEIEHLSNTHLERPDDEAGP